MGIAVLFANGTEEIEALTVVDLVRRAGLECSIVSITGELKATGSHNITITADEIIENHDFSKDDMVVFPGGMPGTNNLEAHPLVQEAIKTAVANDKYLAAICAAPKILAHAGLLKGRKAGIFPGMENELEGSQVSYDQVSTDGKFITSRGLGTAIPFALKIIETLDNAEKAEKIGKAVVYLQ